MKLLVRVIEGRNLPAMDPNGFSDPYVRLQLGKNRFKSKVVKKNLNPYWGEEFIFWVEDLKEELLVCVLDEDKYYDDFVGQLKVPVAKVIEAENKTLGPAWYSLKPKNKKSKNRECGEILLTISLSQSNSNFDQPLPSTGDFAPQIEKPSNLATESLQHSSSGPSRSPSAMGTEEADSAKEDKTSSYTFAGRLVQLFLKNGDTLSKTSKVTVSTNLPEMPKPAVLEDTFEEQSSCSSFGESVRIMMERDPGGEDPSNLPGGILLDQSYVIAPLDLNSLLFSPDSNFMKSLAEFQGTTELQEGPWKFENGSDNLKRSVTYIKAATKLIKAVKAYEEQMYLKANGKVFAVSVSVSTPDVMYGSTFKIELLFCITPGPELSSGEQTSRLVISWRMNFLQSTMMKGMIENGARQGLKDNYEQFADLLSQNVKPVEMKELVSRKDEVLADLQVQPQSDWKLGIQYFANFTVISTIFLGLYVLVHILLSVPNAVQGLEFNGLDLPDSIGEVIVCGILVLQGKQVFELIARFMQARGRKGSDHGLKAQGDGWLLTVVLMEGCNLAAVDSSGFSDPYVVFTCNGKTRSSSIKFQKLDTQWNEIFEFDAMDEPPSVLDVEVYDFDGPFDEAVSLGHAEINFVKSNISDLADVWLPLEGKLAQACQSKLHLRIFLNNTKGSNAVQEYLTKMEKEVGKKINLRSPQTNSAFQKLFGLPPEEFLINDFTCHLKRKMPLQGRLFLSPRIFGYHTNMFGHRTKFFFLWEDIEDIQVVPPTLASMGSPGIIITLRQGRGMDAKHGAKTRDEEGRLKFHFQSFVSFTKGHRTIMALWKARSLSPEQKVQIVDESSETRSFQTEESDSFLSLEDVNMSEVYSSVHPFLSNFFMELFSGGDLDYQVMEKVGCQKYSCTLWELDNDDVCQRQICYKLHKNVSGYKGEVTSTQQRSPLPDRNGWIIEEVMTLQGVPLADHFNLHLRYQAEDLPLKSKGCQIKVFFGIAWVKSTKHQNRLTINIQSNLHDRLKLMFSLVEKEYHSRKVGGSGVSL
ncbi:C2 and GRAM domain-containing protein At1g03370 [Telopea speciosissima]|uniref:C2 and GRAM domain-containing protein At1g03370 n=1 Tax=Telopea speciosissima TaxID=54955 RepID=UPI001CC619AC|nr:C2 and GRAM domain-containing protein At1g03370 [Telopea speciosissima]